MTLSRPTRPSLTLLLGCLPGLALPLACSAQVNPPAPLASTSVNAAQNLVLAPGALQSHELWTGMGDGTAAQANKASWRSTDRKTMFVEGAIGTPFALGSLQNATIRASLRFFVPETCPDYTSVALAFYGEGGRPAYAMVILKNPRRPVGQGVLRVDRDTPITLRTSTWYTLELEQDKKSAAIKVWADGDAKPAQNQWTGSLGNLNVASVGVRTYGGEVEVADLKISARQAPAPKPNRALLPQPVFEAHPEYVDLYYVAWEQAFAHVKEDKGAPQSPYMDEACYDSSIWIWDTCFMSLFTRYSPEQFPGIQSLSNFYAPAYDGTPTKLDIWFADNPPLFAWAEHDNYQFSGDNSRLKWLLQDKQYLQKHYRWFQNAQPGERVNWSKHGLDLKAQPLGFEWSGQHSGMDNTSRFAVKGTLAIDAIAQQGLSALYIARLADSIGETKIRDEWRAEYNRVKVLVNKHYWDEKDGFYYDLLPDGSFSKVRTPASFWPVLAGMASREQVARMAKYIADPQELGGYVPWVTLSRSDQNFNAKNGDYWRGAMWLPTAYMGIRALGENGQEQLADSTAESILRQMASTYKNYEPHTIWECYNPNKDEPSTEHGRRVRPDFCGWSALGPISLFIENVLGFYEVNANTRTVSWRLHQAGSHGIKNLRFGGTATDILTDGQGRINVTSNRPYLLKVNGQKFQVKAGSQYFMIKG